MEIERKFLVREMPDKFEKAEKEEIVQGYVSFVPTIRLRKLNDKYILTCKGKGDIEREEWEIEITEREFFKLWQKVEKEPILKTRYLIPINNYTAELDVYYGILDGLRTVEVEFETVDDAKKFVPPDWFGEDVTYDKRYSNGALSQVLNGDSILKEIIK